MGRGENPVGLGLSRRDGIAAIPVEKMRREVEVERVLRQHLGERVRLDFGQTGPGYASKWTGLVNEHPFWGLRIGNSPIQARSGSVERIEVKRGSPFEMVAEFSDQGASGGLTLTWEQVQARHSLYSEGHFAMAVAELAWGGDPTWDGYPRPLAFTEREVRPLDVVFQRYELSDLRAQAIHEKYRGGEELPSILLVERGGELLTADGHHRLSAAEFLKISLNAVIAHSPLGDKYLGAARIGERR